MNPGIEFAALVSADIEALVAREVVASPHPWTVKMLSDSLTAGADCQRILWQEQRIGYCIVQRVLDEAELLNIVIFKPFQRRGLGGQVMRSLQASLAEEGVKSIYLEVRRSNRVARRLYERSGFIQEGIRKAYYRSRGLDQAAEDALLMVWRGVWRGD